MILDRISYQELFPNGNFANRRLGLEGSLSPGENPIEAWNEMRKIALEYQQTQAPIDFDECRGSKVVDVNPVNTTIQGIIEDIGNCTVVDEVNSLGVQVGLKAYSAIAEQYPDVKDAYLKKLQELTKIS